VSPSRHLKTKSFGVKGSIKHTIKISSRFDQLLAKTRAKLKKCAILQRWEIIRKISRSISSRGWLPKFNPFFLIYGYICCKIFVKMQSVVLTWSW